MSGEGRIRGWAALAVMLISASARAETIEMVTYYPAPKGGGGNHNGQDLQVRSLRVGDAYQTLPVPLNGVAVLSDAMAIGVPVPASGTIIPAGALQVVGIPDEPDHRPDKVLFSPGAGGRMELQVAGNVRIPPTAATGGTATAGVFFAGQDRFIHNYGTENTFLGIRAGNFTLTGARNTGAGFQALSNLTTGSNNTALGANALAANTAGDNNTAAGANALSANTTGNNNTAAGAQALAANTSGNNNTAVGTQALMSNTSGSNNTAAGYQAGMNATGSGNVFLGYQAGMNETGSNKLYIAISSTNTPLIWGDFAAGIVRINGTLTVTQMPYTFGPQLKWGGSSAGPYQYQVGKDLAELFNSPAGPLPAGTIAALGANGSAVAAAAESQTLGPTPALPGILMDGPSQRIGPTPEEVNVPGKSAVALLGRVSVQTEGPVQVGDILVAGPSGKAVRWRAGQSALSSVGLVLEADPKAQMATVLVGHQELQKVLDSMQEENKILEERLTKLRERMARLKKN